MNSSHSVKVSVLIPCYNCADTLVESFESVFSQTFEDFEIVAVDDGSEDNTLALLKELSANDARLKVIEAPHGGIIEALNRGIEACEGEFVARMDADDFCYPTRFEKQVAYLDAHPEITLVSCKIEHSDKDALLEGFRLYYEWMNSLLTDEAIKREFFIESPLIHPSIMMRREALLAVGGYEENQWAEDYDLWLRLLANGANFAKVDEVLFQWRDLPTRLTKTDSRYSRRNFIRAKAHYMLQTILKDHDSIFIWGTGTTGKHLSNALLSEDAPIKAFIDIDPKRIGSVRHGYPIIGQEDLKAMWDASERPILLQAVSSRGARDLIRTALDEMGLIEGVDWFCTA